MRTKEIQIALNNWGCKQDNKTALHLIDIMKNEETNLTTLKVNHILSRYYQKLYDLVGTGKFQNYYMTLVKEDTMRRLDELNDKYFVFSKTRTHINSLLLILFRAMKDMDYDPENKNPLF